MLDATPAELTALGANWLPRRLLRSTGGTIRYPLLVVSLLLATIPPPTALAQDLVAGDLLVVMRDPGRVVRVDRLTGAQTVISSGGELQLPTAVAVRPDALAVADAFMPSIVAIATPGGAQSVLSSGQNLDNPTGIAVEGPDLLVANLLTPPVFASQVLRIAGSQTVLSQVPAPSRVGGVTVAASGAIFVTDEAAGSVSGVNPVSGVLTLISSGDQLVGPIGIAVEANGDLVVADASGLVLRIDPGTGDQTLLASGGNLIRPFGIAVELDGKLIVSDKGTNRLVRLDPASGVQTVVTSLPNEPWGVAVVPATSTGAIPALPGPAVVLLLGAVLGAVLAVRVLRRGRSFA